MKPLQNPTTYFFQQSENITQEYSSKIQDFVKQLLNTKNCVLCKENYNFDNRIPRILIHCGHTFCTECLLNFYNNERIRCPLCLKLVKNIEMIERLPVNHTIFTKMVQQLNEDNRKKGEEEINLQEALIQQFQQYQNPKQGQPFQNENGVIVKGDTLIDEQTGLEICPEHQRIKHFFSMETKQIYCRVCSEELENQQENMIVDLYDLQDIPSFLAQFYQTDGAENKQENPNGTKIKKNNFYEQEKENDDEVEYQTESESQDQDEDELNQTQ